MQYQYGHRMVSTNTKTRLHDILSSCDTHQICEGERIFENPTYYLSDQQLSLFSVVMNWISHQYIA